MLQNYTTYRYAFGSSVAEMSFSKDTGNKYRYCFNGEEQMNELSGEGMAYDLGARFYDARLGRMFSIDPLEILYPWQSTYVYCYNSPIRIIDIKGMGANSNPIEPIKYMPLTYVVQKGDSPEKNIAMAENWGLQLNLKDWASCNYNGGDKLKNGSFFNWVVGGKNTYKDYWVNGRGTKWSLKPGDKIYLEPPEEAAKKSSESLNIVTHINLTLINEEVNEIKKNTPTQFQLNCLNEAYSHSQNAYSGAKWGALFEGIVLIGEGWTLLSQAGKFKQATDVVRNSEYFRKLFTPLNEFDFTLTLFRGTSGSETASTVLFLTDDAAVAATCVKKGGQVMQYQITQYALSVLKESGELQLLIGINGSLGAKSVEYMFKGAELVKDLIEIGIKL